MNIVSRGWEGMTYICKVCSSSQHKNFIAKEMMFGTGDQFDYFQCDDCNCLQIGAIPENIADYYPAEYYSLGRYEGRKFLGFSGWLRKFIIDYSIFHRGLIQRIIGLMSNPFKHSKLLANLKVSRESKILDVGCGNGEGFLFPLAEIGFKNLLGCDPYVGEDVKYRNGLKILNSEIFSISSTWDFIFYHHSFEHLANPKDHLIKIHSILEDHGLCILRIPTCSSYAWEHYGVNWYQLDAPRHFFLHSIESIEILAKETNFDLHVVIFDSTYHQFMHSEAYKNDIPMNQKVKLDGFSYLKNKFKKIKYKKMTKQLNDTKHGDQAIFILKRKSV